MSALRSISEHCQVVVGANNGAYPDGNPLLVSGASTTVQIDAAKGTAINDPDLILLSHYHEDHVVGVGKTGIETHVHHDDIAGVQSLEGFVDLAGAHDVPLLVPLLAEFDWSPIPAAQPFKTGDVYDLGGGVRIHTIGLPGHTAGHCGFFVEPDDVFYVGDIDLSGFGPMYGDAHSSLTDWRLSLEVARQTAAAVYATFHHKGIQEHDTFQRNLATYGGVLGRREARIASLIETAAVTHIDELMGRGVIYREGSLAPAFGEAVERRMIELHLREMYGTGHSLSCR